MNDTRSAQATADPFEEMRRAYEDALQTWSRTWQQAKGGEEMASAWSNLMSGYVAMQESLRAGSQLTAEALHLPSKDDLARVAQLVVNVERKLDELTEETHELLAQAKTPPPPDRSASIDDRLTAIEAKLDALANRPAPAPTPAPTAAATPEPPPAEAKPAEAERKPAAKKRSSTAKPRSTSAGARSAKPAKG